MKLKKVRVKYGDVEILKWGRATTTFDAGRQMQWSASLFLPEL